VIARSQCRPSHLIDSAISTGPVAQFSPIDAIGYFRSVSTAASRLDPTSIVPICSMVMLTISGISSGVFPSSSSAARAALIAHFTCKRSWHVSIRIASEPPATSPRIASRYDASIVSHSICPSVISFVPGPIDPSTNRGRSFVAYASAAARAISADVLLSENASSWRSNSPSTCEGVPNVFVSTASEPAS